MNNHDSNEKIEKLKDRKAVHNQLKEESEQITPSNPPIADKEASKFSEANYKPAENSNGIANESGNQ